MTGKELLAEIQATLQHVDTSLYNALSKAVVLLPTEQETVRAELLLHREEASDEALALVSP